MIAIPYEKHVFGKGFEVKIYQECVLKPLVLWMPMGIPNGLMIIHKLFLSLPVQRGHGENLVSMSISKMKCLLHFQNIHF
jgi:hypothetical protein